MERVTIGEHLLIHGDCLDELPTLAAGSAQLVVTSPPYNLKKKWWDQGANGMHPKMAGKFSNKWYPDEIPEPEYQAGQRKMLGECRRVCSGSICYNHKVRHAFKREGRTFHPIEWTGAADLWCEIIWDRGSGVALNCRRPVMVDERIFVFGRPVAWNNSGLTTVWRITPSNGDTGHPCAFPIELAHRCITSFTNPGDTVMDPYAGSGTTGVACVQTGRRFVGIELERKYFDIACRRIEDAMGKGSLFDSTKEAPPTLFDEEVP